jgi:hypothetical protein
MPKAFIFWIIWLLCLLSVIGVNIFAWNPVIVSGAVILVLTGLLGWQVFGQPIQ